MNKEDDKIVSSTDGAEAAAAPEVTESVKDETFPQTLKADEMLKTLLDVEKQFKNLLIGRDEEVNYWKFAEDDVGEFSVPETSKWEKIEPSEEKLNRLDGLARKKTGRDDDKVDNSNIESWLQSHLPEDYVSRTDTRSGQKRVRWADIEERRTQERMRDVGFVVGHTDWNRMMDPTFGSSALTRTKYI